MPGMAVEGLGAGEKLYIDPARAVADQVEALDARDLPTDNCQARDGYNSHPRVGRWNSLRPRASRGSAVVVMEPAENRDHRDAALELGRTRNRLLLRESLMRTRLVVEAHELGDEASEMVLAEE